MPTAGAAPPISSPTVAVEGVDVQRAVVVYNCTRLGLTANPPGFSFIDFFRFGRRRR
ncbi:hypothetical protein [Mycolicibacterium hodleri]|uniref:hypothetical protein n=1 Tax=Mycolicibacterium hodleri TaxID=49897 RepID=UPI001476BE91|nr:hypothetical protein [Mycolicibacterium hodleri]